MLLEKAVPTGSDIGNEIRRTPDEAQLSHRLDNESDKEAQLEDDAPPDGGTAAWLVVLGGWCCSFNSMGWMNSKPSRTLMISLWEFDSPCYEHTT
jgi:hypothetical protein